MAGKPGKTKRTMTVIWSLGIAIALIVFTADVTPNWIYQGF